MSVGRPWGQLLLRSTRCAAGQQRSISAGESGSPALTAALQAIMSRTSCRSSSSFRSRSFLFAAFQKLGEEFGGVEPLKEAGEGVDGDGVGAEGRGFDAEAFAAAAESVRAVPAGGSLAGRVMRDQQALAFQRAARNAGQQVFVHDPLVQGVLVDDDQAVVGFGDEIAVVKLDAREG